MFALSLVMMACQSTYIPNQANVPLMSEGDEFQIGMSIGSNGYGAQIAYSPYYHWTIAASGNTFSNLGDSLSGYNVGYRHIYGEALTGYYTRLSKITRFEVLGGIGTGYSGHPEFSRKAYNNIILQPSIGISAPNFDIGFSPRFSFVNRTFNGGASVNKVKVNESGSFIQPMLTLRAGYQEFKFQLQGGLSFPVGSVPFTYRSAFCSFGFHINLTKDFDKYTN